MIENFDGGIIDVTSVVLIINKLKLYIEIEEKTVNNIINSFSILKNNYSGDNDRYIEEKKKKLYNALEIMLENRKKYVEYLEYIVKSYIDKDNNIMMNYRNGIN